MSRPATTRAASSMSLAPCPNPSPNPSPNPTPSHSLAPRDERRPPHDFYWAELDTSHLPKPLFPTLAAASRRRRLGYLLEPLLPVDLGAVQAVYKEDGNRALACAIHDQAIAELDPNIASLGPADWPGFIADPPNGSPDEINLLTAARTPACVQRARTRLAWTAALVILTASLPLTFGLSRRAAHERELTAAFTAARHDVYAQVIGAHDTIAPGTDPDTLIRSELNRLARTRTVIVIDEEPGSAAHLLASVLKAWPARATTQTSSISIAPDLITVTAHIAHPDEAQRLTDALGALDGWRADNPSVNPERDTIRTTVRIRREDAR